VNSRIDVERLWPSLAVISCWTDGPSRFFADKLQTLCPSVALDAKGLLATEAAVTVPYGGGEGALPALDSVFIEFIAATGQPLMSHELECGGDYRVVVTTPGGLYRYDLGDRVRCVGFEGSAPRLVFLGRAAEVSDLVGEKLDDAFVAEALRACGAPAALKPCRTPHPHYELWLDKRNLPTADLVVAVDRALRANPQYAYARDLGHWAPSRSSRRPTSPPTSPPQPSVRADVSATSSRSVCCARIDLALLRLINRPHGFSNSIRRQAVMKIALISPKGPLYRNGAGISVNRFAISRLH